MVLIHWGHVFLVKQKHLLVNLCVRQRERDETTDNKEWVLR